MTINSSKTAYHTQELGISRNNLKRSLIPFSIYFCYITILSFKLIFLGGRYWGLYHLSQSHSTSHFCVGYFWVYAWANVNLDPICASLCRQNDRHMSLHPVIGWDGVSQTFCPGWPWNYNPLDLCLPRSRITGLSQHTWPILGSELRAYTLSYSASPFLWWIFPR
jgi:hypothetical protein